MQFTPFLPVCQSSPPERAGRITLQASSSFGSVQAAFAGLVEGRRKAGLPVRGKQSKEEMDAFYAAFFKKSKRLLAPGGVMIFYSNEEGFVKKQLRLHTGYKLLQQFVVQEKNHFCLYIVGMKG